MFIGDLSGAVRWCPEAFILRMCDDEDEHPNILQFDRKYGLRKLGLVAGCDVRREDQPVWRLSSVNLEAALLV